MEKKKMLVIGIVMNCAGTEKSFLSFASCLDYEKFDVDLLLAKKEGLFLDLVPPEINIIEMEEYGDMFTLTGQNAAKVINDDFCRKNPLRYFEILPYAVMMKLNPKKRSDYAMRMWVRMMSHMPAFKGHYDVALAYWGDKTMFYMADKVDAEKKIAWLHFDYANPRRDDALYEKYFSRCDHVITISEKIDSSLKETLPSVADRCVLIHNIENVSMIRKMAENGDTYDDGFEGKRILTVGRISEQKGYDFAIDALKKLIDEGYDVRWYILGDGEENYVKMIKDRIAENGLGPRVVFLGTTTNPYGYIKDADIYAQPSRHEGKPIAVEEAKILCRPIYVSNYLSANEQLEGGKLGIIGDIGAEGAYSGIKKLLDSPEICEDFSALLGERNFGNEDEIEKFYSLI